MKILLISPKYPKPKYKKLQNQIMIKFSKKFTPFNTLVFPILASLTPKEDDIIIVDEENKILNYDKKYDLVGITATTAQAPRAYQIGDQFKKEGIKVVIGGWHPSAMPYEAKQHADSVVVGEAENNWAKLIQDFKMNSLKPFYRNTQPINPTKIPVLKNQISQNSMIIPVQATRGCPNKCDFCSITKMDFRQAYRTRPIKDVINEISSIKEKFLFFCDASLTIEPEYSKALFRQIANLNKKIIKCGGNVNVLNKDEELLKLASEAGVITWFIGFETIIQSTLDNIGKTCNKTENYKSLVKKIHDYGMSVIGAFIFGFDNETNDIFQKTSDEIYKIGIDSGNFFILTPMPGTPLYTRLESEGRILTKDWSKYTCENVVFKPKNMTVDQLENGTQQVANDFYSNFNIAKRIAKNFCRGFYPLLWSIMENISGRAFNNKKN